MSEKEVASIDLQEFAQNFCDELVSAGLSTELNAGDSNYKNFKIQQSASQPNLIKVSFFAVTGYLFEPVLDLNDLKYGPEKYLENTIAMIAEAKERIENDDITLESDT